MMLYMAVTADKYELPIAISSQIYYLARMLGKSERRGTEPDKKRKN